MTVSSTQAGVSMGGDASKPGMALGVEVLPGINGVMSSSKITSLFSVLDYVTKVIGNLTGAGFCVLFCEKFGVRNPPIRAVALVRVRSLICLDAFLELFCFPVGV